MSEIRIAAALLIRADQKTLLVRKRGTALFMQAGGKIEPGEDALAALRRELREELGVTLGEAAYAGEFFAPAAHEPGCGVRASIYRASISGPVAAGAEIEEALWIDPECPNGLALAPLTRTLLTHFWPPRPTPE